MEIQWNRLYAVVAIAGLLGMGSCSRESGLDAINASSLGKESEHVNKAGSQVSRWLTFTDMKAFENEVSKLDALSETNELDQWESSQKGFHSMRTAALKSMSGESDETPVIDLPDPLLATLLNKDGRIQIADTIYQVATNQKNVSLYAIPSKHSSRLNDNIPLDRIPGVITHSLHISLLPIFPRWEDNEGAVYPGGPLSTICDFPSSALFPWWGQKGGSIYSADNGQSLPYDNGRQVRLDYHRWRVGFLFYSSIGVRVKIMKHTRLGGWMSTVKMRSANIEACSKGQIIIPGLFPMPYHAQASASTTNNNNLERNVKWAVAPMHLEIIPDHFNFKFSVNYQGHQIARFIRE